MSGQKSGADRGRIARAMRAPGRAHMAARMRRRACVGERDSRGILERFYRHNEVGVDRLTVLGLWAVGEHGGTEVLRDAALSSV